MGNFESCRKSGILVILKRTDSNIIKLLLSNNIEKEIPAGYEILASKYYSDVYELREELILYLLCHFGTERINPNEFEFFIQKESLLTTINYFLNQYI